jgi:hypothetical protein
VSATDQTGATATSPDCGMGVAGTFVIHAQHWIDGQGIVGPESGLSFVISGTSQLVNAPEDPNGVYTVTGVTNGEELALSPGIELFLCDSVGSTAIPQTITVVLIGTSGSVTINVSAGHLLP